MDPVSLIPQLLTVANFFEVYHQVAFKCYRNAKNGTVQEVRVEIQDAGPAAGSSRYSCVATSEDGKVATGNPGPSLDVVLATVHWRDLDK